MKYAFSKIGIQFRVFAFVIMFISTMTSIGHFIDTYGEERGIFRSAVLAIGGFCLTDGAVIGWGALIASSRAGTWGEKIGLAGTVSGVLGSLLSSVHYIVSLAGFDFLGLGGEVRIYSTIGVCVFCITQVVLVSCSIVWITKTGGGYLVEAEANARLREREVQKRYPDEYYEPIAIRYDYDEESAEQEHMVGSVAPEKGKRKK